MSGPITIIQINDLECGINSDKCKFADDTNGRLISSCNDDEVVQEELNGQCVWAKK